MPTALPPRFVLRAPLSGVLVPIERVPDPVFAQRMVGDGLSIDPTSQTLVAPCDGRLAHVHAAGHALTLRTADEVEVMMHVGLDTVTLGGEGFRTLVRVGDQVTTGTPLVEFDADRVAGRARSLLTQVVITTPDRVARLIVRTGRVTAGEDVVAEIELAGPGAGGDVSGHDPTEVVSPPIVVPLATGLHARPAAVLATAARAFAGQVHLQRGAARANAKSVVALMALEIGAGDEVRVIAAGAGAEAAVARLSALIAEGLGEQPLPAVPPPAGVVAPQAGPAPEAPAAAGPPPLAGVLRGVGASPGIALGTAFRLERARPTVPEHAGDARRERHALDRAVELARAELQQLQARLRTEADESRAAIFAAHEALLEDPDLVALAEEGIGAGRSAAFAWQRAVDTLAARLAALKSTLLAARAHDLRDVGDRVLRRLIGDEAPKPAPPEGSILVAEDLTPSDTATLDRTRVRGFCTTGGGATSHVAILARALALPAVVAIDPRVLEIAPGTLVALDGTAGTLRIAPDPEEVERLTRRQARQATRLAEQRARAHDPAVTRDGVRVEVAGNLGDAAEAAAIVEAGGEGVGLLRSEFLFLDRVSAPSEDEQAAALTAIAATLGADRPLIVRTLDVGGDKPLAYLPVAREENPFLGERGLRLQLSRPDLLRAQLRAVLRASSAGTVRVMFPMVARIDEFLAARAMLVEEASRLGVPPVPAGIMVEVPSAALLADAFAVEADFFSIGTNDLTQYTLAMDRGHPKLAPQVDGLDPAVLRLIARTVEAARARGRWVGVCGGLAADTQAVPLLVGLGVDELSVSAQAIPAVKAQVRTLHAASCRVLATRALAARSAAEVRGLVVGEEDA